MRELDPEMSRHVEVLLDVAERELTRMREAERLLSHGFRDARAPAPAPLLEAIATLRHCMAASGCANEYHAAALTAIEAFVKAGMR